MPGFEAGGRGFGAPDPEKARKRALGGYRVQDKSADAAELGASTMRTSKALTAAESGGAVDNGQPTKSYGPDAGADPMGYLGHMANENVTREGHNVGRPKVGKAAVTPTATRGYRKLPGTAANQIGHARYGEADTGLPLPRAQREANAKLKPMMRLGAGGQFPAYAKGHPGIPASGNSLPPTLSDAKMSIRHHKDSIAFNERHAREHEAAAQKHKVELRQVEKMKARRKKAK